MCSKISRRSKWKIVLVRFMWIKLIFSMTVFCLTSYIVPHLHNQNTSRVSVTWYPLSPPSFFHLGIVSWKTPRIFCILKDFLKESSCISDQVAGHLIKAIAYVLLDCLVLYRLSSTIGLNSEQLTHIDMYSISLSHQEDLSCIQMQFMHPCFCPGCTKLPEKACQILLLSLINAVMV